MKYLLIALAFSLTPLLAQANDGLDDLEFWHGLRDDALPDGGAIMAQFSEKRTHPIRPRPLFLEGTLCFRPGKGLKLAYDNLVGSTLFITRGGVRRSTGGEAKSVPFPEELTPLRNALLSALELDYATLQESFRLQGIHDDGDWTLTLLPRNPEAAEPLERIEIEGHGEFATTIAVHLGNRREITYLLSEHRRIARENVDEACAFDE